LGQERALNAADYTLLVVDDNEENRDLLSRRLIKKGFQVLVAEGGRQALSIVEDQPVDLVLLDIMMPDISGIQVLEELRKTRSAAELPIIMATAKTESEDVVQALELGANDYVTKPIDFPVVLARVQAQLRVKKSKRAQQAAQQAEAVQRMLAGPEARPGGLIAERYRLESRIGSGAFGTVYRAIHLELDSAVAVKVLQTGMSAEADSVARFRREGISACRVRHPNAVQVLDFGVTSGGTAYLVMELLEGHSVLEELLRRRTLPPRACRLAADPGVRRARGRAQGRHHPPRHQALERVSAADPCGRGGESARLRHRQDRRRAGTQTAPDARRRDPRHARVHGAGALQQQALRRAVRRLQPRRDALPDARGPAAVLGPGRRRHGGRDDAPERSGASALHRVAAAA
jgi:CheY-like chemotaxis protein